MADKYDLAAKLQAVVKDAAATDGEKRNARRLLKNLFEHAAANPSDETPLPPTSLWHLRAKQSTPNQPTAVCGCPLRKSDRLTQYRWVETWTPADGVVCPICMLTARKEIRLLKADQKQLKNAG